MDTSYEYTSDDLDNFLQTALGLIKEAENLIRINIRKTKVLDDKSPDIQEGHSSHILTETDKAVEDLLIKGLKSKFDDHKFISEEDIGSLDGKIPTYSNNPTWIIDPIDGTMNFVHGNPLCCISVGLAINRRVVLGIVSVPLIGHTYTAVKGRGAFLNGSEALHVSGIKKLCDAMILMELPSGANDFKRETALANVDTLMKRAHAIRCPGPAAVDMAWVGAASADGFFHCGIHCWDMAAGAIIIQEAGGCVISIDGSEFNLMGRNVIAASSEELAKEMSAILRSLDYEPEFNEPCPV